MMDNIFSGISGWLYYFAIVIEFIVGAILGFFTLWLTFFSSTNEYFKGSADGDLEKDLSNKSQFVDNSIQDSAYGYENDSVTLSKASLAEKAIRVGILDSDFTNIKIETKCSDESCNMQQQGGEKQNILMSDFVENVSKDVATSSDGKNQINRFDFSDEETDLVYTSGYDGQIDGYLEDVRLSKIFKNNLNLTSVDSLNEDNSSSSLYVSKYLSKGEIDENFNETEFTNKDCVSPATSKDAFKCSFTECSDSLNSITVPENMINSSIEEMSYLFNVAFIKKDEKIEKSTIMSEDNKGFLKGVNEQPTEMVELDTSIGTLIEIKSVEESDGEDICDSASDFKLEQKYPLNMDSDEKCPYDAGTSQVDFDYVDKRHTTEFCGFNQRHVVKKLLPPIASPITCVRAISVGNLKEEIFEGQHPSQGNFSKNLSGEVSSTNYSEVARSPKNDYFETFSGKQLNDLILHNSKPVVENDDQFNKVMKNIFKNSANEFTNDTIQKFFPNKNDIELSTESESVALISDVINDSELNVPQSSRDIYNSDDILQMDKQQGDESVIETKHENTHPPEVSNALKKKYSFPKKLRKFFVETLPKPFKTLRVSAKKTEAQREYSESSVFNCEVSSDKSNFIFVPGPLLLRYLKEDPFDIKGPESQAKVKDFISFNAHRATSSISESTRRRLSSSNKNVLGIENAAKKESVGRKRFQPMKWLRKKLKQTPAK